MKRILLMTAAVTITGMLLLGSPSLAHHWSNENENVQFTSRAGDEAYMEDAGDCVNQVTEEEHCVVLYGHIFDLLNPVPINIQRPSPDCKTMARGFSSAPPVEPYWSFNRQDLYSSPGFVEYNGQDCEEPRLHPERGLTSQVKVSQDVPITGYWYMSADQLEVSAVGVGTGPDSATPSAGVLPCITVRMELWTGRYVAQGNNELLANGQKTLSITSTPYGQGIENNETGLPQPPCADGEIPDEQVALEEVTEIMLDMGTIARPIEAHEGFVVGIQWYLHDMGNPEWENDKVYHREWNLHTGPDYPNRIVMALEESVRVEQIKPQLFDGKIYIHTVLNSPWGSYDVDTANLRVDLFDEDGNQVEMNHLDDPILRYSVDHDGHFKPVNATFPWDFTQENLDPGTYTIQVSAANWQHTATAVQERTLTIRDDGNVNPEDLDQSDAVTDDVEDSPALGALLVALAAMGMAGIVSLRRRR